MPITCVALSPTDGCCYGYYDLYNYIVTKFNKHLFVLCNRNFYTVFKNIVGWDVGHETIEKQVGLVTGWLGNELDVQDINNGRLHYVWMIQLKKYPVMSQDRHSTFLQLTTMR